MSEADTMLIMRALRVLITEMPNQTYESYMVADQLNRRLQGWQPGVVVEGEGGKGGSDQ